MAKRLKNLPGDPPGTVRHGESEARGPSVARGNEKRLTAIDAHIERHIPGEHIVFHEIVSEIVHIDVHVVSPTVERPRWGLVTSGMSDLPMTVPKGLRELRYAELALTLPEWWKLDEGSLRDEKWYWPVRLLKTLARFPHAYQTWLGYGHSVPLGERGPQTGERFVGIMIAGDPHLPDGFTELQVGGDDVTFLTPVPLTQAEMDFKLAHDADALCDRFDAMFEIEGFELFDPARPEVELG